MNKILMKSAKMSRVLELYKMNKILMKSAKMSRVLKW